MTTDHLWRFLALKYTDYYHHILKSSKHNVDKTNKKFTAFRHRSGKLLGHIF
jgi:hypothetical protein